jgi:hypothetical protein
LLAFRRGKNRIFVRIYPYHVQDPDPGIFGHCKLSLKKKKNWVVMKERVDLARVAKGR